MTRLPKVGFVARLATLVAVAAVPFALLAGLLLADFAERTQSSAEDYVLDTARHLSADVDREIEQIKARFDMIESLFASGLGIGEIDRIARRGLADSGLDLVVFGQGLVRLFDTSVAAGVPLPRPGNPQLLQRAIDRKEKQISNVFRGPLLHAYLVSVSAPITTNPTGATVGSLYMRSERLVDALRPKLDPSSSVRWALIDREGRYIARSEDHHAFVGQTLAPHLAAISRGTEGTAEIPNVSGAMVVRAFHRSATTGWIMAVSIPSALVYEGTRRALMRFVSAGLVLTASAAFASYLVMSRLKDGLTQLGVAAGRIGRGPLTANVAFDVREYAAIYARMVDSGREIAALAERRDVLLRELVHRSRNMLTIVMSVIHNAFRQYQAADEAKAAVLGRISALALANELVTDTHDAIDLATLIRRAIASFSPEQFTVDGPPVSIGGDTAQRAALLVHELCTNSTKYGALAYADGHIIVHWSHPPDDPTQLVFEWTETGGPPVSHPERTGYGTRLILASAFDPDQPPTIDYRPFGLYLRMVTPIDVLAR